jgi:prepilin peptidase CpaA
MEKYFELSAVVVAAIAAISDLRTRRIPNWLTYTGLLMAVSARTIFGGWSGLMSGVAGVFVAGGIFALFFFLGAMGGGDVKLMGAVGAWMGPSHAVLTLIAVCMTGGFIAFAYLIFGFDKSSAVKVEDGAKTSALPCGARTDRTSPRVPFGLAIAIGTVVCASSGLLRR